VSPVALLALIAIGIIVWKFAAPGEQFLPGLVGLLSDPAIQRGPFSVFSGRSDATGRFKGRDVAIGLQLKRGNHGRGSLEVAIRAHVQQTLDGAALDTRTRDEAGRRALFTIAANDIVLSVEDGWLKARWSPQGFVIFPGRFSEERWRHVLEAMHVVAASLEDAA
jgi:hypothetical protein